MVFRKKSRLFWGCALFLLFLVDLFLLWKVGIVSLGELDTYRDMNFGQSKDEVFKKTKETREDKNAIQNDHGLNCVCKDCLASKKGRGSLFPINQ